jgi:hypothetical protein
MNVHYSIRKQDVEKYAALVLLLKKFSQAIFVEEKVKFQIG